MTYDDPDVICLSETHLEKSEMIDIAGYKFYGHSRMGKHSRRSGGVAVLVREDLYSTYYVSVCCKDTDGILGLKFEHICTGYTSGIVINYLPPANSLFGMDPEAFYARLLQLSYECSDFDYLMYVGDFNSRIGTSKDCDCEVIPNRIAVDRTLNSHGKCLLDFLNDTDSCILNGRFGGSLYTCNTSNGSSVVDYAIVHVSMFDRVKKFNIKQLDELVNELGVEYLIGVGSAVPDHELIQIEFASTGHHLEDFVRGLGAKNQGNLCSRRIPRKFKKDYMTNQRVRDALDHCIARIEDINVNQEKIDRCYQELTKEVLWEMDKYKKLGKRKHTPYKKFWSQHLSALWRDMRGKFDKAREQLRGLNKKKLRRMNFPSVPVMEYICSQRLFDCELRKAKRKHSQECIMNIDILSNIGNPKDFWNEINKLGPRRKSGIVCEALDPHGNVTRDKDSVMRHWEDAFAHLYGTPPAGSFDDDFLKEKKSELENLTVSLDQDNLLNSDITLMEVKKVIDKAKAGKAVGVDGIPTEALQNGTCIVMLHRLFRVCFSQGLLPSEWSKCNIVPIGKGNTSVSTDPLSHRGLAMQCCIFKLYCLILNNRMYSYAEGNELLHETQNGFRRGRSCTDHIFTLTETIKMNLPMASSRVFACFVDIKKAFPSVNRDLLLWKLNRVGINGRMFQAVRASFHHPLCRLRLPLGDSSYFDNLYGTLEGSPNSPLNFGLFLNDLLEEIEASGIGIYYGDKQTDKFGVLAYADDLVFVASTETDLQRELDILNSFCDRWRLNVNTGKTKAMVFRKSVNCRKTRVTVTYGGEILEQVESYKYLGITIDETLSFRACLEELNSSASRAFGAVVNKVRTHGNIGYKSYDRIIHSCVFSILDYGSEVIGMRSYRGLEDIQNRAARYFLGVNRFCPLPCLSLEMGWLSGQRRKHACVLKYYNRLLKMEDDRLPKRVYLNTRTNSESWAMQVKSLMDDLILGHYWDSESPIPSDVLRLMIREKCKEELMQAVDGKTKLRTYKTLCVPLQPSSHVRSYLERPYRSLISQLKCGVLHLRIETGRFIHEKVEERVCVLCDADQIENEFHFIFDCSAYAQERACLWGDLGYQTNDLKELLKHPFVAGKFIRKIWQKRCLLLNSKS